MKTEHLNRFGTLVIILLVFIIALGGLAVWTRYPRSQPLEVKLPSSASPQWEGGIYLSGAVNRPGLYPWKASDSLESLLQGAGGTARDADLGGLRLHVPERGGKEVPQRVNINRAEPWLLKALPGIGETRAQAIVEYRQRRGPFRSTVELARVEGIGAATYEQIKHLITVTEP